MKEQLSGARWVATGKKQVNSETTSLTPKRRAKGKFHYPTAGLFSASLKMKIKIFFLLEIVRNVKKARNAIISLSFPSYVNWQPPENQLCIGERARREVAWRGFGSPQAVVYE